MSADKVPPHSAEAEEAVLGSCLIDHAALEYSLENLVPESFYIPKNAKIFRTLQQMFSTQKNVDLNSVSAQIKAQEQELEMLQYLIELVDKVSSSTNIETYVKIVREEEMLRNLMFSSLDLIDKIYQREDEPRELLEKAEKALYAISEKEVRRGVEPIATIMGQVADVVDSLYQFKRNVTGVSTGYKYFDKLTTGLHPGQFIILAARPGVGKTAMALNIIENVSIKAKLPVLFYSLEMSGQEIAMRLVSSLANVQLQRLRTGYLKKEEVPIVHSAFEKLSACPLYSDFSNSAITAMSIRSNARRVATRLNREGSALGLIVIDYLQLMHGGGERRRENRQAEVAEISRSLKGLARDLNVPVIALSQLNRSTEERGKDGRPQLSDLRESGSIEQDADLVAFLWRKAMYKQDLSEDEQKEATLIIAKNRNGPPGDVNLMFMKEFTRFVDAPIKEIE